MSKPDDDDERDFSVVLVIAGDPPPKGAGRPNAYWQKVREQQEEEEAVAEGKGKDTYGGGYRAVRPAPHGGAASVHSDDTIGAEDLCWCGQPQGHDWPGKRQGRKHPREERDMATGVRLDRKLDRRDMRAYHRELQDFILKCVNEDGLKFRLAKNSVILYPPDGTQPMTVFARSGDRQVRQLHKWYIEHVYAEPDDEGPVDEEALARLAEAASTVDHPLREKKKEPAVTTTDTENAESKQDPVSKDPPVAPPTPESEHRKYGQAKAARDANRRPGGWRPYVTEKGITHSLVVTDGERFRCTSDKCVGTEHEWLKNYKSIGGHMRIYHTDTTKDLFDDETISRRVDTNKHGRLVGEVVRALEILAPAVNVRVGGGDVEELERKVADLEAENTSLRQQIEEFETKQSLMREALGL